MSEEEIIEIKKIIPLINDEELKSLNENFNEIVNKFIDITIKDKDLAFCQYIIKKLQQELKETKENISYLQGLIVNKIMVNYDYESVLKDKFNELELKYIASTDSRNMLEQELSKKTKILDELKEKIKDLKQDLNLIIDYGFGEDASRYDKIYAECAKNIIQNQNYNSLFNAEELERSDN